MNYKYISIPKSRLSKEWLRNNNFNLNIDIATFITYTVVTDNYAHFSFVKSAEEEFICNTQEEFEQMVSEGKLSRII